jgi:GSCFA family/Polysaccharide biosynthesis enzyme WcbI
MKIVVEGNCQAIPLAECLAVMQPAIRVERVAIGTPLDPLLEDGDVIFQQRNRRSAWRPEAAHRQGFLYPRIWFNAFHPDLVLVPGPRGSVLPPMGDYHSSLVLFAWHRGMSASRAAALFCEPVFERLGFFDCWDTAKRTLFEEARIAGMPLDEMFGRWERSGAFMHTSNHPVLGVVADLARALMRLARLDALVLTPEYYLNDSMLEKGVWPIYPELAQRLGLRGAYAFKPTRDPTAAVMLLDLEEFIARSFEAYASMSPEALACSRLEYPAYRDLESAVSRAPASPRVAPAAASPNAPLRDPSPYADLPPSRFWRRAIEKVPAVDVDPVGEPPFRVDRKVRIATAGSCFAQSMSRVLVRHGYDYFVAEPPPPELSADEARRAGYGIFSTRCGNVYTARQLLQLLERAYGRLTPRDVAWMRPDGRYADPFRPQIEPAGFASVAELLASRERHLAAVRTMCEQLDVLIFTLGLTEAWRSSQDGAVFPLAPGVSAGRMDPSHYEFVNFTTGEVRDDFAAFVRRLKEINPAARVVLTVSPQPPIATYEPRHVLVSSTYTKAALRAAADEIERTCDDVWYFPGYEVVAGGFNRGAYYENDLRTVTPAGVEHVMRLFFAHGSPDGAQVTDRVDDALFLAENEANMDAVCDEEAIAFDAAAPVRTLAGEAPQRSDAWPDYKVFLDQERANYFRLGDGEPAGTMDPLAPASMRAPIAIALPPAMTAGTVVALPCTVRNDGDAALASGGEYPVFVCYRWYDADGALTEIGRSIHTPLPEPLEPGTALDLTMRVAAPQYPGDYALRVALLQSQIAWFDDVDPANRVEAAVTVAEKVPVR